MKRWLPKFFIIACLAFTLPLWAQNLSAECGDVLPEHPQYVVGQCTPAIQVHPAQGVVSAQSLMHKPLKAARTELDRGLQAWRKGRKEEALDHLTDAVRLDSGFVEAQIRLGAFYGDTGQPGLALYYFNRALLLEPQSSYATLGKAAALLTLNRSAESEQEARRALQLSPGLIEAHYLLGAALLMQEKMTPEATEHLKIAAPKLPQARAFLTALQARLAESQHD